MQYVEKEVSARGSSTVFLTLILLLVLSLLFTLLEGVRMQGLKYNADQDCELAAESLLAEYCTPLLERYHLFLLDAGFGGGELDLEQTSETVMELLRDNAGENESVLSGYFNLYRIQPVSCEITDYQVITDQDGDAFYELVTDSMKSNLSQEAAETIYQRLQEADATNRQAGDTNERRNDAMDSLAEAEKENTESSENMTVFVQEKPENPIAYIADWKNTGILTLVGVNETSMSKQAVETSQNLENRSKENGTIKVSSADQSWYERILFQEYLMKYFSSYTAQKENTALQYELEYIIAGGGTDKENLATVATRLLAIREAANFVYLQTDRGKCSEALTLATLLIGYLGNPVLVKVMQEGILAAWAFAESVSDVKSLLQGEKIPLIKTSSEWSTDVTNLNRNQQFRASEHCEKGMDYRDYLRILLYLGKRSTQCFRAMDLMEQNICLLSGYETIRMDTMLDKLAFSCTYKANPLFLTFVTVGSITKDSYQWNLDQYGTYLQNE